MQKQAPQRAGGERAMSRKRGDAVGSRCHRREGRGGVLMLFVSTCRASEFCVNSACSRSSHTTDIPRQNPRARLAKIPMDDPDLGEMQRGPCTLAQSQTRTHRRTSVVTIVETHEDSRDERMCRMSAESRFARRARSLRSGVTPLTGSARFRRFYHTRPNAQSDADCRARVRLH